MLRFNFILILLFVRFVGYGQVCTIQASSNPICSGNSTVLNLSTDLTGTLSYTWNIVGTSSSSITISPTATTSVSCSISNGLQTCDAPSITIIVHTIPTITSTTSGARCGSGIVNLSANTSVGTINWYSNSTGGSSIGTGGSFTTPTLNATTTYYVDVTNNGCTSSPRIAVTATINQVPNISNKNASICSGSSFNITPTNGVDLVPAGTTYNWAAPSVSGIAGTTSGSNASSISGLLNNSSGSSTLVDYIVTPISPIGTCVGTSFNVGVTVNTNLTPTINNITQAICSDGTFIVTPTDGSGNIVPTGTTYSWSAPIVSGITGTVLGSNAASISGTLINTTNIGVNVTYFVIPSSGSCTGSNFTVTTTVNPKPSVIAQSSTICSAGTFTVSPANGSGNIIPTGTTYSWSAPTISGINGTALGSSTSSISGTLTNSTNAAIDVAYTVTPSSSSCAGSSFTVTVTVSPKPSVIAQTSTICSVGTFTVTPANGSGNIVPTGTTYSWLAPSVAGITGTASGSSASNISGTLTNTTNTAINVVHTVTPTSGSCTGSSFTVTITVSPKPNVTAQTSTICSEGTFTVSPTNGSGNIVPSGTTYSWSAPSVAGITGTASGSLASNIGGTLTNTTNTAINVVYTVTPTSGSCTGSSFTVTVTVSPKPSVVAQTSTICSAGTFTVTPANGSGNIVPTGTTYSWSAPSAAGITGTASGSSAVSISGTLTNTTNSSINVVYTVTPTSGLCTGSSFSVTITVSPKPNVVAQTSTICSAGIFTVTPSNGSGNIIPTGTTYSWSAPSVAGITGTATGNTTSNISGTLTNTTNTGINVGYTIIPTSGSCTGSSFNLTVTVNPKPSIASNNQSVCSNSIFNGNWSTPDIVPINTLYSWTVSNNTQVIGETNNSSPQIFSQLLTNLTLVNQNVLYNITPISGICVGLPFTLNIEVKASPVANVGADFTKTCIQNQNGAMIGGSTIPGYTYAWAPSTGLNSSTIANPTANPLSTTLYSLTVTDLLSNCSSQGSVNVIVNNSLPIVNAGVDATITCSQNINGVSVGSQSINGINYSWTPISGLYSSNASSTIATPNQTTTYTQTAVNPLNGCQATDQVVVTVNNSIPSAVAGNDGTINCIQNTTGLTIGGTGSTGINYSWSPTIGLTSPNQSQTVANPAITTNYTLTSINPINGCSSTGQVTVFVNNTAPTAFAGLDGNITCIQNTSGLVIGMQPTNGINYSWLPTNGLISTNQSQILANPSTTSTYTLTATNLINGCQSTDQVVVTVNNTPPTVSTGSGGNITCDQNTNGITIGGSNLTGINYTWTPLNGLTAPNQSQTQANPSTTTTYTLTALNPSNGCSTNGQVTVNVNNTAPSAIAGLDEIITCNQNMNGVSLGMNTIPGLVYNWSPSTGLNSSNIANVIANPSTTLTYTLTVSNPSNGCFTFDNVTVFVDNNAPNVNAGIDQSICDGSIINLSGSSSATNLQWSPSSFVSNPSSLTTTAQIQGTTTFTLTAIGTNGCSTSDFVTISVNELPLSGLNPSYEICANEFLQLNVNPSLICQWSGLFNSTSNAINQQLDSSGITLLEITDLNGCNSTEEITINLLPIPYPVIEGAGILCQNSYWAKYNIPSTSNFLHWSLVNGEFQSDSTSNEVYVHWDSINPSNQLNGQIILTETVASTGCQNTFIKNVILDTTAALNPATVLSLSSNVLYIPNDYTFMNWGYESIITHIPVSVGVYSQYCDFNNLDVSNYNYWVEIGDGNGCITKSYFNEPIYTADIENQAFDTFEVFPNPSDNVIQVKSNFDSSIYQIQTMNGSIVKNGLDDGEFSINIMDLPSGVYILNLNNGTIHYQTKIIKL